MSVSEKIEELRNRLPQHVVLVAVSKTHPVELMLEAWDTGQCAFGESRPQEMVEKQALMPSGAQWHMIGHLQRNKVRMIMPFVYMIHSADSARLLDAIENEAARIGRNVDVLLEIHIASEQSKHGWQQDELFRFLADEQWRAYFHINFRGVMGIASNTDDTQQIKAEFIRLRELFENLRKDYFGERFDTLSMGMTSDWEIAVECGGNMVRIGSFIFGER